MWPAFEQAKARHEELERQLADPAVIADRPRYTKLAKEHGSLAKMVKPYQEFLQVEHDLKQAKAMLITVGDDADMEAMVKEEIASLQPHGLGLFQIVLDLEKLLIRL